MSEKNIVKTVNVNGELGINGDKWMMEKIRSGPHTVTIPPSKTCTTGARSDSLWVSIIEDDTVTGVLGEGTIRDNMSWVIAEGTKAVWTVAGSVAKVTTKRTVVLRTTVLRVTRGVLAVVGTLVFWTVDTKMPHNVVVKTASLVSHCGFWAQMGVSRCNSSGIRGSTTLMKGRMEVSRVIYQGGGSRQWRGCWSLEARGGRGCTRSRDRQDRRW